MLYIYNYSLKRGKRNVPETVLKTQLVLLISISSSRSITEIYNFANCKYSSIFVYKIWASYGSIIDFPK